MNALGRKIYLEMPVPSEEDNLPAKERIFRSLRETVPELRKQDLCMSISALRRLHPLCENADWKITVSLSWNGFGWEVVGAEKGRVKRPFLERLWLGGCRRGEGTGQETCRRSCRGSGKHIGCHADAESGNRRMYVGGRRL